MFTIRTSAILQPYVFGLIITLNYKIMFLQPFNFFLTVASIILIPIATFTFASGFFPYKPFLAGLARYDESSLYGPPPQAPFDKIIFMVVDALRSDFVYGHVSGFHFTQSLITSGSAVPFTAHASSPTITMPRIKAISTGSVPSFLDVILNFADSDKTSSLATQDTWLAQMKAKDSGKLIMFGDDTWLKLFPDTFDRADGTSSFFVSDFTEVDNNVTRHIPRELRNQDWNTMVLHYLGIDHIGHKSGPRSPYMIPKQHEMDGIVKQIFEALSTKPHLQSTLLVLLGDHGMNDVGNHGGSSPGETSPALVFISPKLKTVGAKLEGSHADRDNFRYHTFIDQSDITPTLGALLGFPVPRNNLGIFIPQFLSFWPDGDDRVQILLQNAKQILKVVMAAYPSFEAVESAENCHIFTDVIDELACQWKYITQHLPEKGEEMHIVQNWELMMIKWLKQAQNIMGKAVTNYDISRLGIGLFLAILSLCLSSTAANSIFGEGVKACAPFIWVSLLYAAMMFASSYVEEEQNFWYWVTNAWFGILWVKWKQGNILSLLISFMLIFLAARIARRWNQTGQKFAGKPDIAKAFLLEHRTVLWSLVVLAYLRNFHNLRCRGFPRIPRFTASVLSGIIFTASLTFKIAFIKEDSPEIFGIFKSIGNVDLGMSLITRARFLFLLLAAALSYNACCSLCYNNSPIKSLRAIHDLLTLFLYTQSRIENIPLILIFELLSVLLDHLDLNLVEISTTCLLLQYMSFFALGGSNAISSIDLSSAYNAVGSYNVVAVGMLTFISNWAGPIFWTSATNLMLLRLHYSGERGLLSKHLALLAVFVTSSLVSVMTACLILRKHLFIWTVFSPKFLYTIAWSFGQYLCVNVGLGGLLFWLGINSKRPSFLYAE